MGPNVTGFKPGVKVIAVCCWGAFAEEVAAPASQLVHLKEGVSMEAAAALMIAHGTTSYALSDRAHLKPGETLLVLGTAGGTGLSSLES